MLSAGEAPDRDRLARRLGPVGQVAQAQAIGDIAGEVVVDVPQPGDHPGADAGRPHLLSSNTKASPMCCRSVSVWLM